MTKLFKNKYHIESIRLKNWNYADNATYFITIATKNHKHYFGGIVETRHASSLLRQMTLSKIGEIAHQYWSEIPLHFPFVILDAFRVMPNHIHRIVIIDNSMLGNPMVNNPMIGHLQSQSRSQSQSSKNQKMASISPKSGSLSVIIGSYKSAITKSSRKINPDFAWQPRFYDHIVRNEKSLNHIRNYITTNVEKWHDDTLNDG